MCSIRVPGSSAPPHRRECRTYRPWGQRNEHGTALRGFLVQAQRARSSEAPGGHRHPHLSPRGPPSYKGSMLGPRVPQGRAGWPPNPCRPRGPDSAPDSFAQRTFLWPQGGGHPGPWPQGSWATRDAHLLDGRVKKVASDLDLRMASVVEGESARVNPGGRDPGLYSQQSLQPSTPSDWPREHGLLGF